MSSQLAVQLTLFVFSLSAGASPTQGPDPAAFLAGESARWVRPRSQGNLTTANVTDVRIFNPDIPNKELKGVMIKYARAGDLLAGIGINPETHPETGYPPFNPPNSSAIPQASAALGTLDASRANVSAEDASGSSSEAGIIGVNPVAPASEAVTAHMPLTDYISGPLDVLYYGPASFGSRSAVLQVDVDTGSADLWIPVNCKHCRNPVFVTRKSTSFKPSPEGCTIGYGTGHVEGNVATDAVAIGGARVPQQTFCAVTKVNSDLDNEPISGILGLAFGTIAQIKNDTDTAKTFFENLLEQKALAASVFSVHMTRKEEQGSEVCFGCYDPTKVLGPVTWNDITSRTFWTLSLNGTTVNGTETAMDTPAAIDTGTSLIYLPARMAAEFYAQIPGSAPAVQYGPGFYTYPCRAAPAVSLVLNGRPYAIHPDDFNIGKQDESSDDCIGGILALDKNFESQIAIVGAAFLKSWYTVFDYSGRIGFAPSVNNRET